MKRGELARGPFVLTILTSDPSLMTEFSEILFWYSSLVSLVNPHLLETTIFWLPGNLCLALLKASRANLTWGSFSLTEQRMEPILTLAALPQDLPKAPLMPDWSLSAPAHDNILLILRTCQGCTLQRRWKLSLPTCLVRYLLQAIREASRASEETCSTSSETMWTTKGNSPTGAFFLPMSQILILGSGTPLLYLDFGQGLPLHTLQHLAGLLPINQQIIIIKNNICNININPTEGTTPIKSNQRAITEFYYITAIITSFICSLDQKQFTFSDQCFVLLQILQAMTSIFNPSLCKGKLVLVSGGATGICYEISKKFLEHGASVYIISRKIENITKAVKTLSQSTGSNNVWGSSCDVRKEQEIIDTIKTVVSKHGEIDVLVNGAAGNFLAPIHSLSPNAFRTVMMIDTVGTFLLSKYTTEFSMKKEGVIINITANLHHCGTALQSHSGAAKAGVDALTKHMAVEFGPRNIRVVGVSPGAIEGTQGIDRLSFKDTSHSYVIPLQRVGTKADIANVCLFVASSAAGYITGTTINVDGGQILTFPNFPFASKQFSGGYANFGKSKL